MTLLDRVKELCKKKNISQGKMEKEIGISNGASSKWKTSSPSMEVLQKLSEYFSVTVDYLMTGENSNESKLTKRDERDIEKIIEATRQQLISQEGLMFDGEPASPEAIDSIISAMRVGMEMAKEKNKERYTPRKYRKDQQK